MFCSSCGAMVKEGAAFCGSCGRPVAASSPAQPLPGAVASGAPVAAAGTAPIVQPARMPARDTGLYAGFWLRFVAAIIDILLILIPYGSLAVLIFASAIPMIRGLGATPNPFLLITLFASRLLLLAALSLLGSWLYWSLLESSSWQATIGKKALGLYVTDLTGARLSFGKASGRFFAGRGISYVPSIGGLYFLVDCIMVGFTEKKQALHDIIAGCLVQRNA
jgi:uncharacterized RDD family membrane protein YckC